jgi:TonB family protein
MRITLKVVLVAAFFLAFASLGLAQSSPLPVAAAVAPDWPAGVIARTPINTTVSVRVKVDGFGNVVEASIPGGSGSSFESEALAAARDWKFGPNVKVGDIAVLKFTFRELPQGTSKHELRTAFIAPREVVVSRIAGVAP